MPILQTERTFKKITLPSSTKDDPAWVEVWDNLLTSDIVGMAEAGATPTDATIKIVASAIKAWNFTDKAGNVLPVTYENVQHLAIPDFAKIIEETTALKSVAALATVKKNNLPSTLAPKATRKTAKK